MNNLAYPSSFTLARASSRPHPSPIIYTHRDREKWNSFVLNSPWGHLMQSWEWGAFKDATGWQVIRVGLEREGQLLAGAQILVRSLPLLPLTLAYIPKGPMVDLQDEELATALFSAIHEVARSRRAIFLKIEPNLLDQPALHSRLQAYGFQPTRLTNQPRSTLIVSLSGGEAELQSRMRKKTRQLVRKAAREGVEIVEGDTADLDAFYTVLADTGEIKDIPIHDKEFYHQAWRAFHTPTSPRSGGTEGGSASPRSEGIEGGSASPRSEGTERGSASPRSEGTERGFASPRGEGIKGGSASPRSGGTERGFASPRGGGIEGGSGGSSVHLLLAKYQGEVVAGKMIFLFKNRSMHFWGGTSAKGRALNASYLIQWEALTWALRRGCVVSDLWGIPDEIADLLQRGEEVPQDQHQGLWGVYTFKRGFGGEIESYLGAYDYPYSTLLYQTGLKFLNGHRTLDLASHWLEFLQRGR